VAPTRTFKAETMNPQNFSRVFPRLSFRERLEPFGGFWVAIPVDLVTNRLDSVPFFRGANQTAHPFFSVPLTIKNGGFRTSFWQRPFSHGASSL